MMTRPIKFILLICILISGCSRTKPELDISSEIRQIINEIADENVYKSSAVGYSGTRPEQWNRFQRIKSIASEHELIQLTNHKNTAVRSYAFKALVERKSDSTFNILLKHLYDTAQLETLQGCLGSHQTVGDFFLNIVNPPYVNRNSDELSKSNREKIDSILFYDENIMLRAKLNLISNLPLKEKYYNRIREIYLNGLDPLVLVALAKYQNNEDKGLIIDLLTRKNTDEQYHGLRAVRNFVDDDFYLYIAKIHKQEIAKPTGFSYPLIRMLYFVLVQYTNSNSINLLNATLNSKGSTYKYHSEYLWLALEKYPNSVFDGIQNRIEISDIDKDHVKTYWLEGEDY
jgi:hypothetical protein